MSLEDLEISPDQESKIILIDHEITDPDNPRPYLWFTSDDDGPTTGFGMHLSLDDARELVRRLQAAIVATEGDRPPLVHDGRENESRAAEMLISRLKEIE